MGEISFSIKANAPVPVILDRTGLRATGSMATSNLPKKNTRLWLIG